MPNRRLIGTVVSTKQQKTIVVEVSRVKTHRLYQKKFAVSKKYQVHVEDGEVRVGDRVQIEETIPMSRHKHFKLLRKVSAKEEVA
jgi:small subunit ribosomal protein S17